MKYSIAAGVALIPCLSGVLAAPALAQHQAPVCERISDAGLPPALAAWAGPAETMAAGDRASAAPPVRAGVPVQLRLVPAAGFRPAAPAGQARVPEAPHAGLLRLSVSEPGRINLSLSTPAWIDLVDPKGEVVPSVGHGRMAPCTTLRKTVTFAVTPGAYLIQISGNPGDSARLLVSPAP